jgi:hypothetical protein
MLVYKWKEPAPDLPAIFAWRAGPYRGQWRVDGNTIQKLVVPVGPDQPGPEVRWPAEVMVTTETAPPPAEE